MQVLPEDKKLSRWTLSTHQFGRDWAFSWVSQNMAPIPLQKIHWRSVQVISAHGCYVHMHAALQDVWDLSCLAALWSQGCLEPDAPKCALVWKQHQCILTLQGSTGGSLGGSIDISNRGQIRFYRKTATTCTVKLTISYEVPDVLAPFAGALTPVVESILSTDLKRFANLAAQEPLSA